MPRSTQWRHTSDACVKMLSPAWPTPSCQHQDVGVEFWLFHYMKLLFEGLKKESAIIHIMMSFVYPKIQEMTIA